MSPTPAFVLWAIVFFTLLMLNGAIAWLLFHNPLIRLLRRLMLADLVAGWLGYAAAYHLAFLASLGTVRGLAGGLWLLLGLLGLYLFLRIAPSPARRPERLFVFAMVAWSLAVMGGYRYIGETAADLELLRAQPAQVLRGDAPNLSPLRRALLLSRLDGQIRHATEALLRRLSANETPDSAQLNTFRLQVLPELLSSYERHLTKMHTYQWVQIGLMALLLLIWGFGRVPEWETL